MTDDHAIHYRDLCICGSRSRGEEASGQETEKPIFENRSEQFETNLDLAGRTLIKVIRTGTLAFSCACASTIRRITVHRTGCAHHKSRTSIIIRYLPTYTNLIRKTWKWTFITNIQTIAMGATDIRVIRNFHTTRERLIIAFTRVCTRR